MLKFYSLVKVIKDLHRNVDIRGNVFHLYELQATKDLRVTGLFPVNNLPEEGSNIESETTFFTSVGAEQGEISLRYKDFNYTKKPLPRSLVVKSNVLMVKGENAKLKVDDLSRQPRVPFSVLTRNELDEKIFLLCIALNSKARVVDELKGSCYADVSLRIQRGRNGVHSVLESIDKITNKEEH